MKPELIHQKDPGGCGIACLAMVTGYSYEYVRAFYSGKDFSKTKDGITFYDLHEFLFEHGFAWQQAWGTTQAKGLNQKRPKWPIFWADKHIVHVHTVEHAHYVVVLNDGTVLDPAGKETTLENYTGIYEVIAVYPVQARATEEVL